MSGFNAESAAQSRAENPHLTVFDTGEMLEPHTETEVWYALREVKTGTVRFDNEESSDVLSVFAHPSTIEDDTTVVQIDTYGGRFKIMLNDAELYNGDVDEDQAPDTMAMDTVTDLVEQWAQGQDGTTDLELIRSIETLVGVRRAAR